MCNCEVLNFTENSIQNIFCGVFWIMFFVKFKTSQLHTHIYVFRTIKLKLRCPKAFPTFVFEHLNILKTSKPFHHSLHTERLTF